jgi:hypothetical protein
MAELAPNWFESGSIAPPAALIAKATNALVELVEEHDLPVPHVYPIPDGGIQAEWDTVAHSVELRFSATQKTVLLLADPKAEGESSEEVLQLESTDTATRLASWLDGFLASRKA